MLRHAFCIRVMSCSVLLVATAASAATPLATIRVASGLSRPVLVTTPPGDTNRLFIVEQHTGLIRILKLDTMVVNAAPFLVIGGLTTGNEQGLLGLAFHPDYEGNGFFYVNYTNSAGDTAIARYQVSADPDVALPASADILLTIDQPDTHTNHNGGWIGFGGDEYLYIASGDGGGGGDDDAGHTPGIGNGQDITNNLLGAMLRIDVDGDDFPAEPDRNYGVPTDNPFVGTNGDDEIWAFGLRNPWRNSFDLVTGDLWIADVGQGLWEEVDYQPADSAGGENYGWRCREGAHNFNTNGDCSLTPFTEPVHEYSHGGNPFRCSISGGYVYRGCAIPDLRGTYFFADYCSDQIWSFRYDGIAVAEFADRTAELVPDIGSITQPVSFGEDGSGELYVCDLAGEVFKVVPSGAIDLPTAHDYDNDGDVDLADTARFEACLGGPGVVNSDCLCDVFDQDDDGDTDLDDFAGFQVAFTG
ncbi:MAG: PQQ-dependent sugar dehydrogenase [bacterium]|nr:PQQ-dependent sugar dehydrogenase [bacterium]